MIVEESDEEPDTQFEGTLSGISITTDVVELSFSEKPELMIEDSQATLSDGTIGLMSLITESINYALISNGSITNAVTIVTDGTYPQYTQDESTNTYKLTLKGTSESVITDNFGSSGDISNFINSVIVIDFAPEDPDDSETSEETIDDKDVPVTPLTSLKAELLSYDLSYTVDDTSFLTDGSLPLVDDSGNYYINNSLSLIHI